jgi:hypothetical protein
MEDRLFKALMALTVIAVLAAVGGYFLLGSKALVLAPVALVLLFVTVRMHSVFSKDVVDMTCAILKSESAFIPGGNVKYTVDITPKAPFEATRLHVLIVASFRSDSGAVFTEHTESQIYAQNKKFIPGGPENYEGNFVIPDKDRLFGPLHSWNITFTCEIKSALDKKDCITLKDASMATLLWDAL